MKFGNYWKIHIIQEWKEHYIQYNVLKKRIKQMSTNGESSVFNFHGAVQDEVDNVLQFYNDQRQNLERDIVTVQKMQNLSSSANRGNDLCSSEFVDEYLRLGELTVQLYQFLTLNATALRKIKKKYKKNMLRLKNQFQPPKLARQASFRENITRLGDVSVLAGSLNTIKTEIQKCRGKSLSNKRIEILLYSFATVKEKYMEENQFWARASERQLIPFQPVKPLGPGQKLDSAELVRFQGDSISEMINLASTFLYLCNYNISLPTASDYAFALGFSKSYSGIIVGMTPFAAIIAAVGYSYWSNYSYKNPLLCSTCLLLAGNFMYAIAYDLRKPLFIFVGRFVCGLGGARVVNRRWIADCISIENRTKASGKFVIAGALGMSLGPVFAAFLQNADFMILGYFTVNFMTAPGWIMIVAWIFFGIAVVFFFKDTRDTSSIQSRHSSDMDTSDEEDPSMMDNESMPIFRDESFDSTIDIVLSPSKSEVRNNYGTIAHKHEQEESKGFIHSGFFKKKKKLYQSATCLWLIFWLKLQQEALLTELPIVTNELYEWSSGFVGIFMMILGFSVIPVNLGVLFLAQLLKWPDGRLILALQVVLLGPVMMMVPMFGAPLSLHVFCVLNVIVFCIAQVLEGIAMSLFSKIIPRKLATGVWNSGLLATEAGTLGRAMGNALITVLGGGDALSLQFYLYVLEVIVSLMTLFFSKKIFFHHES